MIDDTNTLPSDSLFVRKPVGITKGPGETTHEYTFVSRDDKQVLKNGEYVYYELSDPDQQGVNSHIAPMHRVLGRVMKRVPLKLYPDTFLGEPEISPTQVAAMVGYNSHTNELFELHVAIMGYYDHFTGSFINPWIPPQSGKQIFLADDAMLAQILSRKQDKQPGSATIGSLLTRSPGAVPVVLSVKDVVSTHLAIIASTGAGKSYLASVIIEELMQPHNKACILIIDPQSASMERWTRLRMLSNLAKMAMDAVAATTLTSASISLNRSRCASQRSIWAICALCSQK